MWFVTWCGPANTCPHLRSRPTRGAITWVGETRLLPFDRHEWVYQPGLSVPFLCLCCEQLLSDWQSLAWVLFKITLPSLLWPWMSSFDFYSHRQLYFCLLGVCSQILQPPRGNQEEYWTQAHRGQKICLSVLQLLHPGILKPTLKGTGFWDTLWPTGTHLWPLPAPFPSCDALAHLCHWNPTS